jgi:hypothetical protein
LGWFALFVTRGASTAFWMLGADVRLKFLIAQVFVLLFYFGQGVSARYV